MILGFKGFKPGLVATLGNGKFQYVPNELNETKKAMCASTGFHYCLDPWDCLNWYTWNGKNEFWAVAAGGDVDEDGYGSRSSCTKLVPLRKLTAEEFLLIYAVGTAQTQEHSDVRVLRGEDASSQYPLFGQKVMGRKDIPLEQAAGGWSLDSPLSGVFRFQQSSCRTGISWPWNLVDGRKDH